MQIIGSSFATFLESPASSAASTTAVTSLYAPDGCHVDRWRGPWAMVMDCLYLAVHGFDVSCGVRTLLTGIAAQEISQIKPRA